MPFHLKYCYYRFHYSFALQMNKVMDHVLRVNIRFVVDNYVAHHTQRLALLSSLAKEPMVFMRRNGPLWELDLDITDTLEKLAEGHADAEDMRSYRYVVINEDGSQSVDVLKRTLPNIPPSQSIYDQCVSALVLHPQYESLVNNSKNVLDVSLTLVDDWSFSSSNPWNTSAMKVMIGHDLKVEKSVLNSEHLLNKLFNRCFWKIDDSLDMTDSATTSILKDATIHHGAPEKLAILKVSKVVKEVENKKAITKLSRSNLVQSNLVPVLFACMVPYIFKGERVILTGNLPRFGNWNPRSRSSIVFNHVGERRFEAPTVFYLTVDEIRTFLFKFAISHADGNVSFESGENRSIHLSDNFAMTVTCTLGDESAPKASHYKSVGDLYAAAAAATMAASSPNKQKDQKVEEDGNDMGGETLGPVQQNIKKSNAHLKAVTIRYCSYFICGFFRYPYTAVPRFTSLCVPLFSLRSALSAGVGDFGDLRMLANFAKRCGFNIIQLLPLQDTITGPILTPSGANTLKGHFSKGDSSPYGGISVFALHPIYIRCEKIPGMDGTITRKLNDFRHHMTRDISYLHCRYNYGKVCREKLNFLYLIYSYICDTSGLYVLLTSIVSWIQNNPLVEYWIYSYMLYRYFIDIFEGLDFLDPSTDMSVKNPLLKSFYTAIKPVTTSVITPHDSCLYIKTIFGKISDTTTSSRTSNLSTGTKETDNEAVSIAKHMFFYAFLQMHAHTQLEDSAVYCRSSGICLKGDLSFGTSPVGVDCWVYPEYFEKSRVIGAPPDAFTPMGQNWGYPAYNWGKMEEIDNYQWVQRRLKHAELFFDCVRLDHILGLFRTWELPLTAGKNNGSLGQFVPAAPLHWDWIFEECYDPNSSISWCRSKSSIRARLTEPLLKRDLAHKLAGHAAGDLACSTLIEFGILSYDKGTDSYVIELQEQKAYALLDTLLFNQDIALELHSALIETYRKLLGNICILNDVSNPEAFCHPVFTNRYVSSETVSLTSLEHIGLRDKIRHWSHEYFTTWHNDEWTRSGTKHLQLIKQSTNMMICGEDLGYLHPCIRRVMADLGIIGLRVQRMTHEGYPGHFYRCDDESVYSYLTVAAPSTHDTYPLRAWWEHNRSAACAFWRENLGRAGDSDWQVSRSLSEFDCRAILRQNLHSKSIICCLMLQDIFGACDKYRYNGDTKDEIINMPGTSDWQWKYRIHISLEELHNSDLVGIIGDEICNSGRILQ